MKISMLLIRRKIFLSVLLGLLWIPQIMIADQMIDIELLQGIPNVVFLREDVVGGGAPSQQALKEVKRQGFKAVIDLRTMMEWTMFEESTLKKLGIKYFNIPIHGLDISDRNVDQLTEILSNSENLPALLHCAVGGRVNALWGHYKKEDLY